MNKKKIAAQRDYLRRANREWPESMAPVPQPWPHQEGVTVLGVFRSKRFLAQHSLDLRAGMERISVNRTMVGRDGAWLDDISWGELQRIKMECGFGDRLAVEIYPVDSDVVNVANMRHLWLMPEGFSIGWTKEI